MVTSCISPTGNKQEFDYPIHTHDVCELNFVAGGAGVNRIVGDSSETIGNLDLVLITSPNLEHVWAQGECHSGGKSDSQYRNLSDAEALRYVGEIRYRDIDGDGKITEKDRTIIGDTNTDFIYGFTSNLSWKNFTLSFMLQGSQGNDILNYNLWDIKLGNITRDAYNSRWTPENADQAKWPKPTACYLRSWRLSNRYVEDGSYLRMKYITLSYNWVRPFKNIGIDHINFSFTANNVFTTTNYSWMDPDVNAGINKTRLSRCLLYPLPADEINTNKNINGNNPGWN